MRRQLASTIHVCSERPAFVKQNNSEGAIRWTSGFTVMSGCYRGSAAKCDKEDKVLQAMSRPGHLWVQYEKTEARHLRGCLKIDPLKERPMTKKKELCSHVQGRLEARTEVSGPTGLTLFGEGGSQTCLCILVSRLHMCPIN